MAVSETTARLYRSHAKRFERWLTDRGSDASDPISWVDALQSVTEKLSKKTWRLYRNALSWHLRTTRGDGFAGRFVLASDGVSKPPNKPRRLLRRIEPDALKTIVRELLTRRGSRPKHLAYMMIAMVVTGLRQAEFETAKLLRDQSLLVVKNAKYRAPSPEFPGRGNGETRELVIDPEGDEQLINCVRWTINWCAGRPWRTMAPNVNALFRRVIKKLVSQRELTPKWAKLRLYDCRHQFSANAKTNLNLLAGEVAAAMGHVSVETAVSHYGKRYHGNSGAMLVRPSARSLAAVSEHSAARAASQSERKKQSRLRAQNRASQVPETSPSTPPEQPEKSRPEKANFGINGRTE